MSNSAPWQIQGTPTANAPVKLFNPADFGASTSQPSNYGNSVQQGIQANGEKSSSEANSSWEWNPAQWNSGAQPGYASDQNQGQADQGHTVTGNNDNSGYQGQFYDPSQQQQYYNQQQYWQPNQQGQNQQVQGYNQPVQGYGQEVQGQHMWSGQQYGYGQAWENTSQAHHPTVNNNIDMQQNFQQDQNCVMAYNYTNQDHYATDSNQHQSQEHMFNHQQPLSENDGLNSSAASDYSGSLNQSSIHEDQGATSGSFQHAGPEGFMDQSSTHMEEASIHSWEKKEPINVEHSIVTNSVPTHPDMFVSSQHLEGNTEINAVTSQVNSLSLQDSTKVETYSNNNSQGYGNDQNIGSDVQNSDVQPLTEDVNVVADDQQSFGDWEVVPSQNLTVPGQHSRQGSMDNNVHFFIGSGRNSPGSGAATGTGSPSSITQGQSEETVVPPVSIKSSCSQSTPPLAFQHDSMMPKYTSSPNVTPESSVPKVTAMSEPGPPPPMATPPKGHGGDSNPFRKADTKLAESSQKTATQENVSLFEAGPLNSSQVSEHVSSSKNSHIEPPSPILNAEDPSRVQSDKPIQKKQPQSPIMPRKESPFQPPHRRRNISGSSETIEEYSHIAGVSQQNNNENPSNPDSDHTSLKSSGTGSSRQASDSDTLSQSDRDSVRSQEPQRRYRDRRSRPPPGPSNRTRGVMSPRRMEKVLQQTQDRRAKHNMSPATTLWADGDLPATNILLAPAAPMPSLVSPAPVPVVAAEKEKKDTQRVLSPVENLITTLTEHISKENTPEPEEIVNKRSDPLKNVHEQSVIQGERRKQTVAKNRDKHERNSSIDRELEIVRRQEEDEKRGGRRHQSDDNHGQEHYSIKDQYRDSQGRVRDTYREDEYDAYYDRRKGKDARSQPLRDPYRDPYYGDERYDRPRSRNTGLDDERSSSRQGQGSESDRPRSRQDYSRDPYYRDGRYSSRGGYDYDYYGRQGYYDNRYYNQGYYDSRYAAGYYDEYYRQGGGQGQYNDHFDRLMDFGYPSWYHQGYQSDYYSQGYEDDRYSQRSQSRGAHTPASIPEDQPDAYGGYGGSRSSSRVGYDDYHRNHYDPYYYRQGYGYQEEPFTQEATPGRMTPAKYTIPHARAVFGPAGQLVKVLPNRPADGQPATVEIHEVDEMLQENLETEELKVFPGPLIRGDTHKNDVLSFCQAKARECSENISMVDRESAELIWKFLILLIKQNGTVMGTDIADLLLDGHEPTTAEYSMMGMKIWQSTDNLDEDFDETAEINASTVTNDRSMVNRMKSREEVTDRFRHLLLYGRKKDALEWAMKKNLWGHALFLASKMDNRAHANVMIRFANSAMKMNDPLQTLYQLMSGRQPASVTSVADDRWGDWRPHLAMILSNHSSKPDLDRKSIMSLGDTLASKGFLHASHFCYMMAQASFGSYQKKTSKLVLLGSNHHLSLSEFATNQAIQCTEVYEYAMSLGNAAFFLPNFQYFKFQYACRLADNGFPQEALQYCEVISKYIQCAPTFFQSTLVKLVYNLADRLKLFDPQRMHTADDAEDLAWLVQLRKINQGFEDGSIQPMSGTATPMGFASTRASSESAEVAGLTYTGPDSGTSGQMLYGYEGSYQQQQQQGTIADQSHSNDTDTQQTGMGYQQQYNSSYQQGQTPQYTDQQQYMTDGQLNQQQTYGYYQQGYTANQTEAPPADSTNQIPAQNTEATQYQGYVGSIENNIQSAEYGSETLPEQGQEVQHYDPNSYSQMYSTNTTQQRHSVTSDSSIDTEEDTIQQNQQTDFDYFGAAASTQKIVAPRLRKRTTSETSTGSTGGRFPSGDQGNDKFKVPDPPAKNNNTDTKKGSRFGGWFSKLMSKPKNEMKLPSDDKPSIVWDKDKGQWVNTDGSGEQEKPQAPPPKDSDIFKTPSVPPAPVSSTPAVGNAGAPPMGNKFSRPKGRGARSQYVDVMNTSSSSNSSNSTVPKSLFNVMPTSASSPAIFNPLGSSEDSKPEPQPQQSLAPPAEESLNHSQTEELSRSSSMSSVSYEVQQLMQQNVKESNPPAPQGPPMMFNPSQFKTGQQTMMPSSGPKLYNQRRVYPK